MTTLTNPHARLSGFTTGQPAPLPAFPEALMHPTSDVGKQAHSLFSDAQEATARLQDVRDAQIESNSRERAAGAALEAEIVRGGREGRDLEKEHELALELAAAQRLNVPETHHLRYQSAVQTQRAATARLGSFLWEEVITILNEELREEAELASAELIQAYASIQHSVDRYKAVQQAVWNLLQITVVGEHGQAVGQLLTMAQEPLPPLPSDEGIQTFESWRNPEPEHVEPEGIEAFEPEPVAVAAGGE